MHRWRGRGSQLGHSSVGVAERLLPVCYALASYCSDGERLCGCHDSLDCMLSLDPT